MNKAAKVIRILTIPTLIYLIMMLITILVKKEYFTTIYEVIIPLIFLAVVPLLAYPLSYILGKNKTKDDVRSLQRKLAFIFSVLGYSLCFILSYILKFNAKIMVMSYTYFITVILLSLTNLFIKASGHAAGIVGPMLLLCYYIGWIYIIPCIIIYALSFWSSIYLKRHTPLQFVLGTIIATISFLISFFIYL